MMRSGKPNWIQRLLVAAMAAGISLAAADAALAQAASEFAEKKGRDDYNARLESVRALAVALKQQAANEGVSMAAVLTKVESRMRDAQSLAAAGEIDMGRSMLDEGYRMLQESMIGLKSRASAPVQQASAPSQAAVQDGKRREIERELASTKALLDALKRQDVNKGSRKGADISRAEALIRDAEQQLAAGNLAAAERSIHDGYGLTKGGIISLQSAGSGDEASRSAEQKQREREQAQQKVRNYEQHLKSVQAMKEVLRIRAAEAGVNRTDVLARVDGLLADAARLVGSDVDRALSTLAEARAQVKGEVEGLRLK